MRVELATIPNWGDFGGGEGSKIGPETDRKPQTTIETGISARRVWMLCDSGG